MIAYHFPPVRGSSGVQRTLRFAQHLPKFGWDPVVLTITPRAYPEAGDSAGNEIPPHVEVHRAFGLDAARQLRVGGRYPGFMAVPDRWRSWRYWAVPKGRSLLRGGSIHAIWSTFPIATAHQVGLDLARSSGLPWIAEFRDPMWQGSYPPDPAVNGAFKTLESKVVERAQAIVMTTPSAVDQYRARFGDAVAPRLKLIENGYDEEVFARAEAGLAELKRSADGPVVLLHSGLVYRSERDPTALFDALARLKEAGLVSSKTLRIVLRASGHEAEYRSMLETRGIADLVELAPGLDYLAALREMISVDGLLLMQASNCNAQIPAKLYEYLRAGRPLLALTDPEGDTARTLRTANVGLVARLDSVDEICEALLRFLQLVRSGEAKGPAVDKVSQYSRQAQAHTLAQLLNEACRKMDPST